MTFSDHQIQDLRERADIASLIGKRVELRRSGANFMGLCPFHGERSPSFSVVPSRHFFNCFGCGEKGDVFRFFMKLDGMSFVDAVKLVAQEMGVILVDEKQDPEEARRRAYLDELAQILDRAVKFYEQKFWHDGARGIREYVRERGVSEESIRRFRLGFGGYGRDDLAQALARAQVPESLAIDAGLCGTSQHTGRTYDRFSARLIVPIRVPRPPDGRAVGLGGRFLEGVTPAPAERKAAKYINSPETALYQKSHVLFGLPEARDTIRKEERALVVEGYFDVIGVHQAGVPLAVATCGTTLTPSHLDLLLRVGAKEIVFLFDGDDAGTRAASKAAEMCAKAQVPARVAILPEGLDPDDFARERGADGVRALIERARPAVEVLIDHALDEAGPGATVEERVRAVHAVRDVVLSAPEGLSRELYIAQIADRMKVSEAAVKATLAQDPHDRREPGRLSSRPGPRTPLGPRDRPRPVDPPDLPPVVAPMPGDPPPQRRSVDRQAPAPPADPAAAQRARLAKKTLSAEEGLAIALLRYPVLATTIEQEGGVADFANGHLRQLCEGVLGKVREGLEVEPAALVATVADPELQRDLARKLTLDDSNLQQSAEHFQRVLDKLLVEIGRARSRALVELMAESTFTSANEEYRLEIEQKLRANSERLAAVQRRMSERNRKPGGGSSHQG